MALYILGNGFDLAHGLKTRYSDFREYLANNKDDDLKRLKEELDDLYDQKELWSDFEKALGNPNVEIIKKINSAFGLNLFDERLFRQIKSAFESWIRHVDNQKNEKTLPYSFSDDTFITFNYTTTLEKQYEIHDDRILHIHGYVIESYFKPGIFVLGHNKEINKDSPEILKVTKKDTSKVIANNSQILKEFMSRCHEVKMIGFSYSDIDLPYFIYLANLNRNAIWNFGYYSDNDKQKIQEYIEAMGLQPNHYKTFCTR